MSKRAMEHNELLIATLDRYFKDKPPPDVIERTSPCLSWLMGDEVPEGAGPTLMGELNEEVDFE